MTSSQKPLVRIALALIVVLGVAGGVYKCRASLKVKATVTASSGDDGGASDSADAVDAADAAEASDSPALGTSTVSVLNDDTKNAVVVYVAFGSDSVVLPGEFPFCVATSKLTCNFSLPSKGKQALPLAGRYLNATLSFDLPVGCGVTKAEVNVNNPSWYDILDVSLVDGYSNEVLILATSADGDAAKTTKLGPPNGASNNEDVLGLYPLGCDICVGRQSPPCGIPKGDKGCKHGTQYKPDVPCQWQGNVMGGGTTVEVVYSPPMPARAKVKGK